TIATCQPEDSPRALELARAGAKILSVPGRGDGRVAATHLMTALSEKGVNVVLCEGGSSVAAGLLAEGMVDEIAVFVAPKLLGAGLPPIADLGLARMAQALPVEVRECVSVGHDILIRGLVRPLPIENGGKP
ncbi:MAG: dihydrofolate reductase family protein, partial [Planctomycetota bacterium]|nr:dihydrofolate reductase family protein [Planctomycetota bacterium]